MIKHRSLGCCLKQNQLPPWYLPRYKRQAEQHRFLFNRRKGSFLHVQVGKSLQQHSRELFFYCQKKIICGLFFFFFNGSDLGISQYKSKKGQPAQSVLSGEPPGEDVFLTHLNGTSGVSVSSAQLSGLPRAWGMYTLYVCKRVCIPWRETKPVQCLELLRLFINLYHNS